MRSCFIPMCDYWNKEKTKRRFFMACPKRLTRWQEILSKHHLKQFRESDKICEMHFDPEDIDTKFITTIKGQIVEIDRLRPKLKAEANPCRNLSYEKNETQKLETPQKLKLKKVKVVSNKKATRKDPEIVTETVPEIPIMETVPQITESLPEIPIIEMPDVTNDFLTLYEEIYEVTMPSTLWSLFRCPRKEFISFAFLDSSDFTFTKQVILFKDGKYKVKIKGQWFREIQLTADKINCDFISKDIEEIDAI